ncbi:hypothetical protein JL720_10657 [Aureococcus anophagefferens]|nr:hypothetical protein JL720_10657 [Aureococcus anophagefferens]
MALACSERRARPTSRSCLVALAFLATTSALRVGGPSSPKRVPPLGVSTLDKPIVAAETPKARPPPPLSDAVDMVGLDDVFEDDEPTTLTVEDGKATQNPIGYALDSFTGVVFSLLHLVDDSGIVVVIGAGFDTRAMRYAERSKAENVKFFELDLPHVCEGKGRLWDTWAAGKDFTKPQYVPYDLNDAGDPSKISAMDALRDRGFDPAVPTLFCSEAVLFYVDDAPKRKLFETLLLSASTHPESAVVLTDNLKPLLISPFSHERRDATEIKNSFLPISGDGAALRRDAPSFDDAWYAVCYDWQLERQAGDDGDELGFTPYATRLFGEPLVLYKDASGSINCVADACPHRSAPLSMGRVGDDGNLRCFYHGWAFGAEGERVDVPGGKNSGPSKTGKKCAGSAKHFAVADVDGLVYVWRGNVLEADLDLLPRKVPDATPTHAVDTVLDYRVGFEYIVENNLDSVHLFHLHDGSIPPIAALGMRRDNVKNLLMKPFADDVGVGHVGKLKGALKPNKLVRFDAPNVVRHGGVSGFHEEFHIVPVAPHRTRVLLRQHLPKGPILTTLLGVPGVNATLDKLVNNWNYHIGLEDYNVMQGQQHMIDDLGAPRINAGGKGDDLIARFYDWRAKAMENDGGSPYFDKWAPRSDGGDGPRDSYGRTTVPDGAAPRDYSDVDDGPQGTLGIKETFHAVHPVADFPPANPERYLPLWDAQAGLFSALGIKSGFNPDK